MTKQQKHPDLFLSLPHDCSYLAGKQASTLFVDPGARIDTGRYGQLLQQGFRRSGRLVYRPHCGSCSACVAVRIPVNEFAIRRGQKRILQRNQDLVVTESVPRFDTEHYRLYRSYQQARHNDGSMDQDDPKAYEDFLAKSNVDTRFFEIRMPAGNDQHALVAIAVTDVVADGLSAVYTFFDPEQGRRGLGVFSILWQIRHAARLNLPYVYLGYWIKDCHKMSYKQDYRPLQGFFNGIWSDLDTTG